MTLTPVVVNATRLPAVSEVVRGLTGRTATLDGTDLDSRGVRTLADALEELPGVTTADELGAPAQLDVTLRGFQVSPTVGLPQGITVYVDGVRVNEPDANEVNFDILPLEDVERVDVVYGPSVLFGRNSLGAAVNLVTRRGEAPGQHGVELSGGSFGRYEAKVQTGDRHGMWDYYVGLRYEHEDGWRQMTESRIATAFAKLGLLTATWDATLSYSGADNWIHQAGSLPEDVVATRPRQQLQRRLLCAAEPSRDPERAAEGGLPRSSRSMCSGAAWSPTGSTGMPIPRIRASARMKELAAVRCR